MQHSPKFLARIFRAFRYRDFRLMWTGACVSTIGTFVQQFAQSWLVYDLTKDAFYLGLDLFLGQLPIMLFSLFGGVFADRLDRREMLLASQYIQMVCAFLLALLFGNSNRDWFYTVLFAFTISLTIYATLDVEYTRLGFVRLTHQIPVFDDLRNSMK
jgi:MFS family permease